MDDKTVVTEEVKAEKPKKAAAKRYTVDSLGAHCRKLFGVSPTVYAGATAGLEGEYSVDEMKNIITKWAGKKVD